MLKNLLPDRFVLLLLATIAVASVLPARGAAAVVVHSLVNVAIAGLFFLHGAKLSRESVIAGVTHWRLQLCVLASTWLLFPLLGLLLRPLLEPWTTPALYAGVLYLCLVPSTVQSSIVLTSMARGNVPAAVCAASLSNLLGVFATPVLAALLLGSVHGGLSWSVAGSIVSLLLVPFVLGQFAQRWVAAPVRRYTALVGVLDKGMLMLIVYAAFSASVRAGLWQHTSAGVLAVLFGVCVLFLAVALAFNRLVARGLGFAREDEVVMVFCGSKKSLASGIPIAQVLFSSAALGPLVLPLMIFHPLQLMVCTFIARHYGRRP
ncbi:MAG: bile acid:sodium symporter [Nevskiaceae bacterium]|nr:MAG: bile acid:sodium symporter [Nevskiaceae bacterium]TBR73185.1 MAG: bile acid:sodium symporter [Nevskiaceae bacterium]